MITYGDLKLEIHNFICYDIYTNRVKITKIDTNV